MHIFNCGKNLIGKERGAVQGGVVFYYSAGVCLILCLTLICLALSTDTPRYLCAQQELLCVAFLSAYGYAAEIVTKKDSVWLPLFFWREQNMLQTIAGIDLARWRGYRVNVYECALPQENTCALVYLYGETVLGGFLRIDGKPEPLHPCTGLY